jgi:hypothetical protein
LTNMKSLKYVVAAMVMALAIIGSNVYATTQVSTPSQEYIVEKDATQKALSQAGFQESEVSRLHVESEHDDGTFVYEVEFSVDATEYEYDIDAKTGEVVKSETEPTDNHDDCGDDDDTTDNDDCDDNDDDTADDDDDDNDDDDKDDTDSDDCDDDSDD